MAKIAAVPDVPPRAILYLRQSVHRDDSVSLELQETACRDHCARHGYDVIEVRSDPGISGRTWKRPGVVGTLAAIEAGEADVIVLWRWSRLSRSRRDWAVAIDRIEAAGGKIESATEPVDVSTASGRFARGMLAELAAFDSEMKGEVWKEAHMRRLRAGLPHSGKGKWGYVYDNDQKIHVPHETDGPMLASLYRRYAAGESFYSLVRALNSSGFTTQEGNLWRDSVLRRVLDSGFAAGRITYKGQEFAGVHEYLITAEEFAAYKSRREDRRITAPRTVRSQYLLSGMARCHCGSSMTAGQFGHQHLPKMRCNDSKERGAHGGGGYVMIHLLERIVIEWLQALAEDVESATVAADLARAGTVRRQSDARRLAREITALDEQLAQLTRHLLSGTVPESAYVTTRDEITVERGRLVQQLAAAEQAAARSDVPAAQAAQLLERWDELSVELRREMLKQLIKRIDVKPGRPRASITIVPVWEG